MKITVKANSIYEEYSHLEWLHKRKEFYNKIGHYICIPKNEYFKKLWKKDGFESFGINKNEFGNNIYNESLYEEDVKDTKKEIEKIDIFFDKIKDWGKWGFKVFDNYQVKFSAYGTGGAYNYLNGDIIILISSLRAYKKPFLHTIIHEVIHMGIEESIVLKNNLEHWEKEALVDAICINYFSDILKDYKVQEKVDEKYFKLISKDNIFELPKMIENLKNK